MGKGKVLIVEDNDSIRDLYASAFELSGINVSTARDGEEGVEKALTEHPDVILMDILMPKLNGHEAVSKIRQDSWGKHAKLIYLTNLSDAENVFNAVELKSDEYIVKSNTDVKEVVNRARSVMYT